MAANDLPGIDVAVYQPGTLEWTTAVSRDPSKGAVGVDDRFNIASVSKTFTATLVWQAIDARLIDPDAPIGPLPTVPSFPYTQLTVHQLLAHTTGLVNYRDTPQYSASPSSIDTPEAAIATSGGQALMFRPGSQVGYSSTNYLVLGVVLERVTGRSYDSLVQSLIAEAGIGDIPHDPPAPGEPNFSTAGLEATATQLAHWAVALLHDNTPHLSDAARKEMMNIDEDTGIGPGLWGYCPCTVVNGAPHWAAYGHSGSTTIVQYSPDSNVAIVVNATDQIWVPDTRQEALKDLFTALRGIVTASR
jgi:CubicO group peptidase (beta-lactamase class C family)